jgi:hypothetical protein
MPKVTIVVDVAEVAQVEAVDAWFAKWQAVLTDVSDNEGCGCCVNIWEVEGPMEALLTLPEQVVSWPGLD